MYIWSTMAKLFNLTYKLKLSKNYEIQSKLKKRLWVNNTNTHNV